ncbi:MAG: hypothetical protein L0L01_02360 [Bifidobacterium crudilactis]|nr:hypothetical protein [Bifidobacterium crudilactis]
MNSATKRTVNRVLIANRGEIAVRIIRACADTGRTSIAVYADDDVDALFVQLADEAYPLEGRTPQDSYLHIGNIIQLAVRANADAIHPGYGFLSENADFAQAVIDAGLVWIGPPPEVIRLLGDKVQARRIAAEVGAPMAPGTTSPRSGCGRGGGLRQNPRAAAGHQSRVWRRRARSESGPPSRGHQRSLRIRHTRG